MSKKILVTLNSTEEAERLHGIGCEEITRYPDGILVRATEAQELALNESGLETAPLEAPPIQMQGAAFHFDRALEANDLEPIAPTDPNRTAYYLVQLVGPPKGEWLKEMGAAGAVVHGSFPSFSLLIGIPPAKLGEVEKQDWVEAVAPYRPAMKIAPQLRGAASRLLEAADLAHVDMSAQPVEPQQVKITVFPGESTAGVAAKIREAGGAVLAQSERSVTAIAPPAALAAVADRLGVQAILPHGFPKLHNNVATGIMGVPANHGFQGVTLRGAGQVVAVADSGLDNGDVANIHLDFRGRIASLVSFPTGPGLAPFTTSAPGSDDGSDDVHSAHGTHVAGSVLGNADAAQAANSALLPAGTAPEAQVFFQAIEQTVVWKTRQQLIQQGLGDPGLRWPPEAAGLYGIPDDLNDLFRPAYAAGARIHTNSWGSSSPQAAGQYTDNARAVDEFMWEHRDMLILFAAGNEGVDKDGDGFIDPGSVSPPGTAKNCLTVGASENDRPAGSTPAPGIDGNWNQLGNPSRWPTLANAGHVSDDQEGMAAFSSRGPTDEGRIKPELVAPGTNILSARSSAFHSPNGRGPLWGDLPASHPLHGIHCWSGGTSMSTPLVAGAAALVRQYLIEQRGHFIQGSRPSGALIKALLIHGAAPMRGHATGEIPTGPNSVNGFGRVHLVETLTPAGTPLQFDDDPDRAVESQQIRRFSVQASDLGEAMKVTLAWTDAPSPVGQGSLENSLYLQVRTPGGQVLNGDLSAFPTATNNVQQVVVPQPVAGAYEIRVRGLSIARQAPGATTGANPRQDFALVATNVPSLTPVP